MSPFKMPQIIFLTVATATGLAYVAGAAANDFPTKPIRLVVPLPAGSGGDISGRLLAQRMSVAMSASVFVDNRTGALGTVGSAAVARMPADGYTILLGNAGSHGAAVSMFPTLVYDPVDDFTPITLVNRNFSYHVRALTRSLTGTLANTLSIFMTASLRPLMRDVCEFRLRSSFHFADCRRGSCEHARGLRNRSYPNAKRRAPPS